MMEIQTVLLITPEGDIGEIMAKISSGRTQVPRYIIVQSEKAVDIAWQKQVKNEIFYHSIYTFGNISDAMKKKKEELGIIDGEYKKGAYLRVNS